MATSGSILSADTDKAHFVAQGTLCALALASVLGAIAAAGHGTPTEPGSEKATATPMIPAVVPQTPPTLAAALKSLPTSLERVPAPKPAPASLQGSSPIPAKSSPAPASTSLPALGAGMSTSTAPGSSTATASLTSSAVKPLEAPLAPLTSQPMVPPDKQIKNPQVIEAVEAARAVRRLGDMAAALESLRAADLREPNHPEIMGEMAITYEAMGLGEKATAAWRTVLAMGQAVAGGYYTLAKSKLDGADTAAAQTAPMEESALKLGNCQVIRDPAVTKGERITVRVTIVETPGAVIDPSKMDIHVFLFEQVNNGERIEQVRAETPEQNWVSAPVDWKDPEGESIDVTYDLTPPKPGEVRDLGKRSFHGFIVKLFYQNKLVGEQYEPQSLRNFTQQQAAPSGVDNSLFPK